MSTLILELAGPLQSWGTSGRFQIRPTDPLPSKSGVIGLIAAALGRQRDADLSDLSDLTFGVRADQPGTLVRDFHAAHLRHPITKLVHGPASLSERYYLQDAVFLAAVEGDPALIGQVAAAIRTPAYALFLGRRSCPPSRPLIRGITEKGLVDALSDEPWAAHEQVMKQRRVETSVSVEIRRDRIAAEEHGDLVSDVPVSFSSVRRSYATRTVVKTMVSLPNPQSDRTAPHDPFTLWS